MNPQSVRGLQTESRVGEAEFWRREILLLKRNLNTGQTENFYLGYSAERNLRKIYKYYTNLLTFVPEFSK